MGGLVDYLSRSLPGPTVLARLAKFVGGIVALVGIVVGLASDWKTLSPEKPPTKTEPQPPVVEQPGPSPGQTIEQKPLTSPPATVSASPGAPQPENAVKSAQATIAPIQEGPYRPEQDPPVKLELPNEAKH